MEVKKEEKVELIEFNCSMCNMKEKVHYLGTSPPFSRSIDLKYPSYIMKDPFSPLGKGEILVLGADCDTCGKPVCISKECSLFYTRTYCLDCVRKNFDLFPLELTQRLNKR